MAIVPGRIDRGAFRHRATRRTALLEYSGGSPCCSLAPGRGHAFTALKFFFTDDPGPWAVISHKPTSRALDRVQISESGVYPST